MMITLSILAAGMLVLSPPRAYIQGGSVEVFDLVQAPREWTGGTGWFIEFRETWSIFPGIPAIRKSVERWAPRNDSLEKNSVGILQGLFISRIGQNLDPAKGEYRAEVFYEFVLLDSHVTGSERAGFSEPDSMDAGTRKLQQALIRLVDQNNQSGIQFNLEEQMLSVWFRETWELDPVTLAFTREVRSVTPVIWQRRRTTGGEVIDEPGTGYPVYFKNRLQPIPLRNP